MATRSEQLLQRLKDIPAESPLASTVSAVGPSIDHDEVTLHVPPAELLAVCESLRDDPAFAFSMMVDLCGVDYASYGKSEWSTESEAGQGFSRAVDAGSVGRLSFGDEPEFGDIGRPRFSVAYHLLSIEHNVRLRVHCAAEDDDYPVVPSVTGIWACADWYERECFDLFGILFEGHNDLRRLLTDYGFVGYPFRKDFPLVGNVEMRFDPDKGRVVYEPVSIEPRVLVPRVIREDSRYTSGDEPPIEEDAAEDKKSA